MKPGDAYAPEWLKRGEELLEKTSRTPAEEAELAALKARAGALPADHRAEECCAKVGELFLKYGPELVLLIARQAALAR